MGGRCCAATRIASEFGQRTVSLTGQPFERMHGGSCNSGEILQVVRRAPHQSRIFRHVGSVRIAAQALCQFESVGGIGMQSSVHKFFGQTASCANAGSAKAGNMYLVTGEVQPCQTYRAIRGNTYIRAAAGGLA